MVVGSGTEGFFRFFFFSWSGCDRRACLDSSATGVLIVPRLAKESYN